MNCLLAKVTPILTSCVMAELEKLGPKYMIALRIARDEGWERLQCDLDRVMKHKIYIVATGLGRFLVCPL